MPVEWVVFIPIGIAGVMLALGVLMDGIVNPPLMYNCKNCGAFLKKPNCYHSSCRANFSQRFCDHHCRNEYFKKGEHLNVH